MSVIKWTIAVLVIIGIFGAVLEANYITPDREAITARNEHGQFLAKNKDEFVDCYEKTSKATESTLERTVMFMSMGMHSGNLENRARNDRSEGDLEGLFEEMRQQLSGRVHIDDPDLVIGNIMKRLHDECDDIVKEYKQRFEEFEDLNEQIAYDSRPIIAKVLGMDISTESYLEIQGTEREFNPDARLNMGISREEAEQLILSEIK